MIKNIFYILSLSLLFFQCTHKNKQPLTDIYGNTKMLVSIDKKEYFNEKRNNPISHKTPKNIHIKEKEFVNKIFKATTGINWYERGPYNQGGRTRALALDIDNNSRIVVGSVSGGIWISEDLGETFQKSTSTNQFHSVTCIAQDHSSGNHNIWYYGTGEQNGNSSDLYGNGIFKSINNGITWSLLPSTSNDSSKIVSNLGDFRYVKDIKIDPTNGNIVVASFAGIFLSQDGGNSWTNVLVGGANPDGFGYVNFGKQTNIDVSSSGVFYATLSSDCVDKGIWKSSDAINWTNITPAGFSNSYRRIESGISPSNENQIFFIADVSTSVPLQDNHQLWKYNSNSNTWKNKTANIPFGTCTGFFDFDFGYFQSQNSYDLYIAVHPSDTNIVFLGGTNLYRSTDGFSTTDYTWIGGYFCDANDPGNYVYPNHHPDNHAAVFIPETNIMISAHDGGLSKTTNCKANNVVWQSANKGYNTTQFYTIAIEPGNTESDIIMGGLQDNGTFYTNSLDANQDWVQSFYGDGAYCAISENKENYYVSWQSGKTFKAKINEVGKIENISRIDPSGASGFSFINSFILDPTNNNTMYLSAGKYLWRNDSLNYIPLNHEEYVSNDLGWSRIYNSNVFGFNQRITTLDMSKNSSDIIYYGTNIGQIYKLTGLDAKNYVRTKIDANIMPSTGFVSCLEVDNDDENSVFATFSNYEVQSIFHSSDAGSTWENISGNLEEFENGSGFGPSVNWFHIHYDGSEKIYLVATTSGLFSTKNINGNSTIWAREGFDEIGNVPVNMITSREYDNNIIVATHGNGVFSSKKTTTAIKEMKNENNRIYLSEISPNPVKDDIIFSFRIDKNSIVEISIIDMNGKNISVLKSEEIKSGTYKKRWSIPNGTSKGVYNLVLKVNNKILSKHFIIQ